MSTSTELIANMSQVQKDTLLTNLLARAVGNPVEPGVVTAQDREAAFALAQQKEHRASQYLETQMGITKIAQEMANPVRQRLDYKGIIRRFAVTEILPPGVPMFYDKDIPQAAALVVGRGTGVRRIEMWGKRVYLDPFPIVSRPKVPWDELYIRRFRSLERTRDRIVEGISLREDLKGLAAIDNLSGVTGGNETINLTTDLNKWDLAYGFANVENRRLRVGAVLMSAYGISAIRSWRFQDMDQAGLQELRESGYLGDMWGASFYISDQIPAGTLYILATKKFLAYMPFYKDLVITPANDPDNTQLGFVGYELLGMSFFNSWGIQKVTFIPHSGFGVYEQA